MRFNNRRFHHGLATALLALGLIGCSTNRGPRDLYRPTDVGVLVLDGILIVGKPYPTVFVRQTLAPDALYNSSLSAVHDASVAIIELGEQGQPVGRMDYAERFEQDGRYAPYVFTPLDPGHSDAGNFIRPGRRYTLLVNASEPDRQAVATTLTPAPFHITDSVVLDEKTLAVQNTLRTYSQLGEAVYYAPENELVYQEGLLEARFPRDGAIAFQVGLKSLDTGSARVLNADFLTEDDYALLTRDNSSPVLEAAEGRIRLPWFAIFWAGRYRVMIHSVDQNWYDFVRSAPQAGTNLGFGGNAGDNFERPIFHVDGGIGLFGSAAVDSLGFFIQPPGTDDAAAPAGAAGSR